MFDVDSVDTSAVRPAFRIDAEFVGVDMESKVAGGSNEDVESLSSHPCGYQCEHHAHTSSGNALLLPLTSLVQEEPAHALHIR